MKPDLKKRKKIKKAAKVIAAGTGIIGAALLAYNYAKKHGVIDKIAEKLKSPAPQAPVNIVYDSEPSPQISTQYRSKPTPLIIPQYNPPSDPAYKSSIKSYVNSLPDNIKSRETITLPHGIAVELANSPVLTPEELVPFLKTIILKRDYDDIMLYGLSPGEVKELNVYGINA